MGLLTVVAALSGILVAIGPLFLKVIGPDTSVPTVLGVLVAAFVTLGWSPRADRRPRVAGWRADCRTHASVCRRHRGGNAVWRRRPLVRGN